MRKIVFIVLALGMVLGCKKKKTTEADTTPIVIPTNPPQPPVFFINIPTDADGVILSSRIPYTFSNNYTTQLGSASAFFYTAPGNYNYVDAGTVICNDSVLVKQSSGSYYYAGKAKNGQALSGIDYTSGSIWTISGTANVPTFSYTTSAFPADATLTSSVLLHKNSSYNATFSGTTNADSIVILLGCDSVLVRKTVSATSTSCTFTQPQVASVKKAGSVNKGFFNFISYKLQPNVVSSKKYYMVNSTTATFTVNIQ